MPNINLDGLKRKIAYQISIETDKELKRKFQYWLYLLEVGIADYEEQLQIARMSADRHPECDGARVGRPDDDFAD